MNSQAHVVYRYYDASGRLLYLGMTQNFHRRDQQHARRSPWWPQVADATVSESMSFEDADRAEWAGIEAEKPLHNRLKRGATPVDGDDVEPDEVFSRAVAALVRQGLAQAGISMGRAAELTGIPLATLHRRLTGVYPLRLNELTALSALAGLSVTDVFTQAESAERGTAA